MKQGSKRERIALEYAEAVTYTDGEVTSGLLSQLKSELDEDAIAELTAVIAFQNLSSKFNSALDVPPQGFCISLCRLSRIRRSNPEYSGKFANQNDRGRFGSFFT